MADSPRGPREDRIDQFAHDGLTAAESRRLALDSLEDPRLFEELTAAALAKAALDSPSGRRRPQQSAAEILPMRIERRPAAIAAAAAIVIGLISIYLQQPSPLPRKPKAAPALTPALAYAAKPGQPILLAEALQQEASPGADATVFRGAETNSRGPRPSGAIVSLEDGIANIDLGSLDGVAKGEDLEIVRGADSAIGRLTATAVFRERARGRISGARDIRVGDQVRVAPAAYLSALLDRVSALASSGDSGEAEKAAEQAVQWAEAAAAPSDQRATAWNVLAVLRLLRGNREGAEVLLRQAIATTPKSEPAYARSANNLGVLAELRGDRRQAEVFYTEALRGLTGSASERRVVESNLARVSGR
jgi:tetratricopeptide (TPR) repeat protein